ncbi:MAG TPA: glycosyltransferase [Candidatus Paceibacterota bacterium]
MYDIGICGHFGLGQNFNDGQTIKTRIFTEELKKRNLNINIVDTYNWKHNPFKLFFKLIYITLKCRNIIIMPDQNGIKVIMPLLVLLKKIFNKKLYYVVIGGWLPVVTEKNKFVSFFAKRVNSIFVETKAMSELLKKQNFKNIKVLPNFKRLKILDENELIFNYEKPYKLCIYSRIMPEKGIEDAINAINAININSGEVVYSLDIYGQIDKNYKDKFEQIIIEFPVYIKYKGIVDYDKSVEILKDYFVLLFPTKFKTEGIPGTIIDAFAAGVPVLTSNFDACCDIVEAEITGYIYEFNNYDSFLDYLILFMRNPSLVNSLKINCLKKVLEYTPDDIINRFITFIS